MGGSDFAMMLGLNVIRLFAVLVVFAGIEWYLEYRRTRPSSTVQFPATPAVKQS